MLDGNTSMEISFSINQLSLSRMKDSISSPSIMKLFSDKRSSKIEQPIMLLFNIGLQTNEFITLTMPTISLLRNAKRDKLK